ncbi:hypothetical protein [Maribacter sp. 2307UL18-2]
MKKDSELVFQKFKIAKLQKPGFIFGGSNRTNVEDPECGEQATKDNSCDP